MSETPEEHRVAQEELTKAVTELTKAVTTLQDMIRDDYPKRHEIERDFVTKYGINKRRRQLAFVMVGAIIASFFWTISTVSYCLLSINPEGTSKPYCSIIPGYNQATERNQRLLKTFSDLIETTETNRAKIDELDADVQNLKKG